MTKYANQIGTLIVVSMIGGCAHDIYQDPQILIRPEASVSISNDRQTFVVTVENISDFDLACKSISYSVIWENPEIYMVRRRDLRSFPAAILAGPSWSESSWPKKMSSEVLKTSAAPARSIIRDVELPESSMTCKAATLLEICRDNPAEVEKNPTVQIAMRASDSQNCFELVSKSRRLPDSVKGLDRSDPLVRQYFPTIR